MGKWVCSWQLAPCPQQVFGWKALLLETSVVLVLSFFFIVSLTVCIVSIWEDLLSDFIRRVLRLRWLGTHLPWSRLHLHQTSLGLLLRRLVPHPSPIADAQEREPRPGDQPSIVPNPQPGSFLRPLIPSGPRHPWTCNQLGPGHTADPAQWSRCR